MKEHPILFSTESVKAILDGRKTQTRRVIKPQPIAECVSLYLSGDGYLSAIHPQDFHGWFYATDKKGRKIICPYGQVGDRLWVRETFHTTETRRFLFYKADADMVLPSGSLKWRPSIFMPRWASRITLEIIGVRVERLQEITIPDIEAEGLYVRHIRPDHYGDRICFAQLWDSLNAKRGYGWSNNPWVWCISFRKIE